MIYMLFCATLLEARDKTAAIIFLAAFTSLRARFNDRNGKLRRFPRVGIDF